MKKGCLLITVLSLMGAVAMPAMADLSTYSKTESGTVGYGTGTINLTISYADGSSFKVTSASGFYGDTDGVTDVLHLEANKAINVKVDYSGKKYSSSQVGADFLVWDGACTGSYKDAILNTQNYPLGWFDNKKAFSGTWSYVLTYDGDDLLINGRRYEASSDLFDLFAQVNKVKGTKVGIGVQLDFTKAESGGGGTVVPAPAALLLGSMGLGLVGWTKRRLS